MLNHVVPGALFGKIFGSFSVIALCRRLYLPAVDPRRRPVGFRGKPYTGYTMRAAAVANFEKGQGSIAIHHLCYKLHIYFRRVREDGLS